LRSAVGADGSVLYSTTSLSPNLDLKVTALSPATLLLPPSVSAGRKALGVMAIRQTFWFDESNWSKLDVVPGEVFVF
jgi:hypothetical protein